MRAGVCQTPCAYVYYTVHTHTSVDVFEQPDGVRVLVTEELAGDDVSEAPDKVDVSTVEAVVEPVLAGRRRVALKLPGRTVTEDDYL